MFNNLFSLFTVSYENLKQLCYKGFCVCAVLVCSQPTSRKENSVLYCGSCTCCIMVVMSSMLNKCVGFR